MEAVVTTGAMSRAKLQSNHHHQQTNIQFFTGQMPFLSHNQQCQTTEGKNITFHGLAYPKLTWGLPTLSLTTSSSWLPWGGCQCHASYQPSNASTPSDSWNRQIELLICERKLEGGNLTGHGNLGENGNLVESQASQAVVDSFVTHAKRGLNRRSGNFYLDWLAVCCFVCCFFMYTTATAAFHSLLLTLLFWRQEGHPVR